MEKYKNYLKSLIPFVAEAYTHVLGEEFEDIIKKRLNNAMIIPYYDVEGLYDYLKDIKRCKRREYSIKFLDKIGLDVEEYKRNNYTEPLDGKIGDLLYNYIYDSYLGFGKYNEFRVPLLAFKENNNSAPEQLLENKIKIINYLLKDEHEEITKENFESFTKTEEYQQVLIKINEFKKIYEQLLSEYKSWEEQLKPYEEFIKFEQKRKSEILKKYKIIFSESIFSKLPLPVINSLSQKTPEERSNALIGIEGRDIGASSFIESFGKEKIEKLKSKDTGWWERYSIVWEQSKYLKNIGIIFPNEKILECNSLEDVIEYLEFINQDSIKEYIPSDKLINYIKSVREKKYEEAIREYYVTRKDFISTKREFGNDEKSLNYIYDQIKNKRVCITGEGVTRSDGEFVSLMFYTIRGYDLGILAYSFIHECGHIIEQSKKGTGFESVYDYFEDSEKNSYDKSCRKHEKFNETINDIFSLEAEKYLNNKGIYLIEPQEYTLFDKSNRNTASLTKKLLKPLLIKFKKQVIRAKINSNHEELTRYIGEENYEELVDAINKVDYLTRNGVAHKIDNSPEDEMVKEYYEELARVNKIYSNIDKYYEDYINKLNYDPYNYIKPRR